MSRTCPSCRHKIAETTRFCPECGVRLEAAPSAGRSERKTVTVLFCDLAGFTAASEREDPEDVQRRLRGYHEAVRGHIESFGGTVEKFIGDAVMAVFGAPAAHEDDPERAVRAALRIIEAFASTESDAIRVRIGVNTGEVVVDLDARPERGEGFVTGDVVNTAARIQAAAPIGAIAVGAATYEATRRVFEYDELPDSTPRASPSRSRAGDPCARVRVSERMRCVHPTARSSVATSSARFYGGCIPAPRATGRCSS